MATPGADPVTTWIYDPVTDANIEITITYAELATLQAIRAAGKR